MPAGDPLIFESDKIAVAFMKPTRIIIALLVVFATINTHYS